jgi:hypothetical protein
MISLAASTRKNLEGMNAEETAPKSQLRRAMSFRDVLLFNIASPAGPRRSRTLDNYPLI